MKLMVWQENSRDLCCTYNEKSLHSHPAPSSPRSGFSYSISFLNVGLFLVKPGFGGECLLGDGEGAWAGRDRRPEARPRNNQNWVPIPQLPSCHSHVQVLRRAPQGLRPVVRRDRLPGKVSPWEDLSRLPAAALTPCAGRQRTSGLTCCLWSLRGAPPPAPCHLSGD